MDDRAIIAGYVHELDGIKRKITDVLTDLGSLEKKMELFGRREDALETSKRSNGNPV